MRVQQITPLEAELSVLSYFEVIFQVMIVKDFADSQVQHKLFEYAKSEFLNLLSKLELGQQSLILEPNLITSTSAAQFVLSGAEVVLRQALYKFS